MEGRRSSTLFQNVYIVKEDIFSGGDLDFIEYGKTLILMNHVELLFKLANKRMLRILRRLTLREMKRGLFHFYSKALILILS